MAGPHQQQQGSTASKQQLSVWGLPQPILDAFHKKGLKQLYPWQAAALECAAAGNNLVYCAPTSGDLVSTWIRAPICTSTDSATVHQSHETSKLLAAWWLV